MVIDPFRSRPVLAATLNLTVPSPVPLAPDVIVIHGSLLTAVHEQLAVVLTATLPLPPAAGRFCLFGEIEYEQGATAAWFAVKVRVAIDTVPVRAAPRFGVTRRFTEPSPVPLPPDTTTIHDALLTAVHAHPLCVSTFTFSAPPSALKL